MSKKIAIFIVGPTASGKSELAVELAKQISGVIISADSMQVYKDMHIASAAPDSAQMQGIEHKLIEFLPYGARFSVADYADMAREEIGKCFLDGKTPIIAGGTGLYINALADNIHFLPQKTDGQIRAKLGAEYDILGGEEMLKRLELIDSAAAEKLNPADKRRIVRALEIYETSGVTKTVQNERSKQNPPEFTPVMIGITYKDRQKLYDRINARVDTMIEKGLVGEAQAAIKKDGDTAVQAIGHKEFLPFFAGEQSLVEAIDTLKRATRRYAKRQLTWFNRDTRINWIYRDITPDILGEAMKIIDKKEI